MKGERISTWKIPFPRPGDAKQQWPDNDPEDHDENDDDDDLDNGFDDSKGSGAIRDFSQSYHVAKGTNNQDASSAMMWSCRNHIREPVQEPDGTGPDNWDLEIEDNESESTYTQPTVRELVDPTTSTDSVFHVIFSPLKRYLSDHQQYELLVLGLKRRPLNIIIGTKDHPKLMEAPPQRQKSAATQSSEPSSPPHEQKRASGSKPPDHLDPSTFLPASKTVPKPAINYAFFDQEIPVTPISDRIRYLFLERLESYIPGYHSQTVTAVDDHAIKLQAACPQIPTDSTVSSRSAYSVNDSLSHQSSISTVASAIPVPPPWDSETLNQHIAALPYDYGYDLPCEFGFIGCNLRFHPEHFEAWIDHTISHFLPRISPPLKSICIFCDTEFDCTASPLNARSIWRDRMLHIGSHFQARVPSNYPRPDFFLIEYMHANSLISLADYREAKEYTERPHCDGLVPRDFQTDDMKRKNEKELQVVYDLDKEERTRRKEIRRNRGRGKGKEEYKPSRKSRPVYDQYGSFQAIPLTREEGGLPEREADLNKYHGDYEKEYRDCSSQENKLMLLTENHGIKIQGNYLKDSEKPNIIPVIGHRSNSEHSRAIRRSRSRDSSQSHAEAPSWFTELSSLSGSNSPNICATQSKRLQPLPDYYLLSDETYFSGRISKLAQSSNPSRSPSIGVSNGSRAAMAEDQERLQLLFLGQPSERRLFDHPGIPGIVPSVWAQEPIAPTDPSYPHSLKGSLSTASTTSSKPGSHPPFQKKGYADSSRCYGKFDRIHSRVSSSDSHEAYCSGLSTGQELYTSSRSHTGYHAPRDWKYRTPDNGNAVHLIRFQGAADNIFAAHKYISATSSGAVEVIAHGKGSLDFSEPRASDATSSQYKNSQYLPRRPRP
jgi:hypothetical protein